ncbi:cell division protein FtsX, partial [Nitrincola sp. A-D6]|uniref:ABC transporter permease n=1 Tax=Nitrincola sp. A-D6 TaxID=1545442 RepID=UPI00051FE984
MFRPFSLFIGLRYTAAKRGNHFISFISLVSMLGLTLGVAALIVVLSVMNGFDRELRQRILGMVPHATLSDYQREMHDWQNVSERVERSPQVVATAPYVHAQGMLTHAGQVQGILVNGIDPELEPSVSIIDDHFLSGSLDSLVPGDFNIILGDLLARHLAR